MSAVGAMFPLHCTANGKAILALLTDREAVALLPRGGCSGTRPTPSPSAALPARARPDPRQRRRPGPPRAHARRSAAGFAVRDAGGQIAAITVPMPTQRFAGREREIVALLSEVRRDMLDAG
ncbi:MAG: IclR family transcriptional regulator C-terminal domain-containing protein [Solirubrobacterales bacterium]